MSNDFGHLLKEKPAANPLEWIVGKKVKPKYRTRLRSNGDSRYATDEICTVLSVHPSGFGSVHDQLGVLRIEAPDGEVFLVAYDDWMTA